MMGFRSERARRILALVAIVILVALLIVSLCGFQDQPYPPTLCEALLLLGTAAFIQTAAGALIAVLVEYWPAWKLIVPKAKRLVVIGFCLVFPVAALGARVLLCGAVMTQDTLYLAAAAGAFAFLGSQLAHIYKLPSG